MPNLTATQVKNAGPGRHSDGNGLILAVTGTGSRSWVQRITIDGKRRDIGLGGYPTVTLAQAREAAVANRAIARRGGNPLAHRDRAGEPTFEAAAARVHREHAPGWRNPKHAGQWISTLRTYVFPRIGTRPVSSITTTDVMAVLMTIWHEKPETARRVRQRISTIMRWAVAHGYRTDDPAGVALSAALPRHRRIERVHHRALPYGEVTAALAAVQASQAFPATRLAFAFLVLTAARSGEVRFATWAEIDWEGAMWTVPKERMKAGREHRVPLSPAALDLLVQARALPGQRSGLVFPSPTGKVLSDSTLSKLLRELGIQAVPHGFRSSFRDWASECTHTPHAVMEAALAHAVKDKAEAAYSRSDHLAKRRRLFALWARYLQPAADTMMAIA